jgi:hypothetical protein
MDIQALSAFREINYWISVNAERQGDCGETSMETSHVEDSDVPMWLQILDEEAAQLLGEVEN